jgi:alpha-tubulin suppressor-like RCC1 family protein
MKLTNPIQTFQLKELQMLNILQSIACGSEHSAAIVDGSVYTWGNGESGRLGHGTEKSESSPKLVEALEGKGAKEVVCGSDWTCVLTESGDVYSFGYGANGRLGLGSDANQATPKKVDISKVKFISCGHDHTFTITESGDVYSWGYGGNGRLGHGGERDEKSPRVVEFFKGKGITFVACGGYHTAAIGSKGELYTFGWNHFGQLGFDGKEDEPIPTVVDALKGKKVHWVSCGESHTLAIAS